MQVNCAHNSEKEESFTFKRKVSDTMKFVSFVPRDPEIQRTQKALLDRFSYFSIIHQKITNVLFQLYEQIRLIPM